MLKLIILLVILNITFAQQLSINCRSKKTCGECIQYSKCSWHKHVDDEIHCKPEADDDSHNNNTINPNTTGNITKISDYEHMSISEVDLKIRSEKPYIFDFMYKHKKNLPIDIYFLLDMSKSMAIYHSEISTVANKMVNEIKKKSEDVYIGFGSFVDKTILPYTNVPPNMVTGYKASYSFRNHLKLTSQVNEFSNKVNSTPTAGNLDGPEGSLEALLQAIVCSQQIGWRNRSRHWIVLSTDDAFHIAGDGKIAGIVEPNDGECHLQNDEYTHGLLQDYPSVGLINDRIKRESKNILFLVTTAQEKLYGDLIKQLGNSYIGTWKNNIDITNILLAFYQNTTSQLSFDHNFPADLFSVNYTINKCESCFNNITIDTFEVSVMINLEKCPTDGHYNQTFFIKPGGFNEQINIDTRMLCDCQCEYLDDFKENSKDCREHGNMTCGVCKCMEGKIGSQCECDANSDINFVDYKKCINPITNEICSTNGDCKCGQCVCYPGFNGTHCECNYKKCSTPQGVCSGNGLCNCNTCECKNNWSGPKCECSKLKDSCMMGNQECSNHGHCECGACACQDNYRGQFCEDCINCPKTCNEFENCVKCFHRNLHCENCIKFNTTYKDNFTETCTYNDENCLVKFSFIYNSETGTANIFTRKDCKPLAASLNYMFYTLLPILFIGILILAIWTTIIKIRNKKEYEKFLRDKAKTQWSVNKNPLFKDPISNFPNPAYGKKDD